MMCTFSTRPVLLALAVFKIASATSAMAAPGVYHDRVDARWFAGGSRFWYREDLRGGAVEFIVVDAEKGTRQTALDHARAATALGEALGAKVAADRLPIQSIDLESVPGAVVLTSKGKQWQLDLQTYKATPHAGATPATDSAFALARLHPSSSSSEETKIDFLNQTKGPVDMYWIDTAGKRVKYATIRPGEQWGSQTYVGHVWLATDAAGKSLGAFEATSREITVVIDGKPTATTNPTNRPERRSRGGGRGAVSPDGKWVVDLKVNNLVLRSRNGNEEFPLTQDGKAADSYSTGDLWWSPDSLHLAALRTEAGQEHKIYTVESSPQDQLQPKLRTLDYRKAGDRIEHPRPQLFDVAAHKQIAVSEELFPNPWSITDLRWAADSSRFTFVYNQRGHQALRIVAVDASNGSAARAIVDEKSKTFIDYSGKYFCRWMGEDEIIWMSERDGWNHLWLYDAKTGKPKNVITAGEFPVQKILEIDEAKRQILFTAGGVRAGQDPYFTHICRVNFDGTGFTILTEGDGTHAIEWSPDRRYFIDTWSRVDQPPVNELRRGDTGALVCKLEEADASEALASHGRWPEHFTAKGRDGATDICGIIHFPRDFNPEKKYPVLEEIYAGPQDFYTPKSFRIRYGSAQQLADRGMIVVQCDGMGTSGRSKAFHDVCFQNLRDAGFPDRIAWMKAAAAKHPQMDLSRVGIYGGSAGGQNAMAALLWHNDFYKVAVADCGCHDNRMDKIWWNEQWMGWPVGPEYAENSNAANAKLLKGKLMLVFGELDDNVDPSSTMQVVNALEKANKDFELVIVTGAHHGAAETPYGSHRRAEFLTRNLLGS